MEITLAGIQAGPYEKETNNFWEKLEASLLQAVKEKQPYLIALSELMHIPYFMCVEDDQYFKFAETLDGDVVARTVELASKYNVHIVGTLFEKEIISEQEINYYNSAFICSPTRGLVGVYRKVHLPLVDDPSLKTNEKFYFEQFGGGGTDFPVFTLDNGMKIGCLICFDRSFPEAWKCLTIQGVDLVVVCTATYGFRYDLYIQELKIRAMENNVFVLAVNKAGREVFPNTEPERYNFGSSSIIEPDGKVIATASDIPWSIVKETIELKKNSINKSRINWNLERKPNVYAKYLIETIQN